MTTTTTSEQHEEQKGKKRGRGPGQKRNPRYSLLVQHPDRASERVIMKICGRSDDSIEERHRRLLRMQRHCYTHDMLYRWFLASPGSEERVLYLTIERSDKARHNVQSQVSRLGLSSEQVAMTPIIGETTEPSVPKKRAEVQV